MERTESGMRALGFALLGTVAALVSAGSASAQQQVQQRTLPPGTNPAQRVVYPAEDQPVEQQQSDQLECYYWSSDNTGGWDPFVAHAQLVEQGYASQEQASAAQGGAIRGAAGGALGGLAIGAIAGDAGKGAAIGAVAGGLIGGIRSRNRQADAQAQAQAAVDAFNAQFSKWDRNWVACMEGRGYTVN